MHAQHDSAWCVVCKRAVATPTTQAEKNVHIHANTEKVTGSRPLKAASRRVAKAAAKAARAKALPKPKFTASVHMPANTPPCARMVTVEVCKGAPAAMCGWVLTDRHGLVP